jgi:hypothetical protein
MLRGLDDRSPSGRYRNSAGQRQRRVTLRKRSGNVPLRLNGIQRSNAFFLGLNVEH